MGVLPKAQNGQPYTHAAWAEVLRTLAANPKENAPWFNHFFGPQGFDGAEILRRLKSPPPKEDESLNQPYLQLVVTP
jgi:hypothetical protein